MSSWSPTNSLSVPILNERKHVEEEREGEKESEGKVNGESLCPLFVFYPQDFGVLGYEFSCYANVLISGLVISSQREKKERKRF